MGGGGGGGGRRRWDWATEQIARSGSAYRRLMRVANRGLKETSHRDKFIYEPGIRGA